MLRTTLTDKLQSLKQHITQQTPQDLQLYIPLQGRKTPSLEEPPFDLQTEISGFMQFATPEKEASNPTILLLSGETGSGKSVFCQDFHAHLWQNYQEGAPIPLWIPLPHLDNPFENAVGEVLTKAGFSEEDIRELKQKEKFIFIVDGYDELHQFQNLYVTNQWSEWNAKILIACRSQALYYVSDSDKYFMPFVSEKPIPWKLRKWYVAPFSESQIEAYLTRYQQLKPELTYTITRELLNSIPGLSQLITTPFLLHLTVEALPDILEKFQGQKDLPILQQQKLTQAQLYDVFIEHWFKRQEEKLRKTGHIVEGASDPKPHFWQYCKSLAQAMHERQITYITHGNQPKRGRLFAKAAPIAESADGNSQNPKPENLWEKFFALNPESELLRSACPLRKWSEHQYGFIHASLIEYFATRALYEEMCQTPQTQIKAEEPEPAAIKPTLAKPSGIIHCRIATKNTKFIGFMADRVQQDINYKAKLFEMIETSKHDEQYAIGASNAITALNRAHVTFSGMDLCGIKIPEAELAGAIMHATDLRKANLQDVNLSQSYLADARLEGANLTGLQLGQLPFLEFTERVNALAYSPDGQFIAIATGNVIELWDLAQKKRETNCIGHTRDVTAIAYSPTGDRLVSGSDDGTIRYWNVRNGMQLFVSEKYPDEVKSVAHNPDGYSVAAGSMSSILRQWNTTTGRLFMEYKIPNEWIWCVAYNPDGTRLAFGTLVSSKVHQLDVINNELVCESEGHTEQITCLAYSSDSRRLVSGSADNTIRQWETITGRQLTISEGHTAVISSITYSWDGKFLVSGSEDGSVRQWDAENGKQLRIIAGHPDKVSTVRYRNNSNWVASGGRDGTVRLWNMELIFVLNSNESHTRKINSVALSPSELYLVSGSDDGTVRGWGVETGDLLFNVKHKGKVTTVAYSPDGEWIVSGSSCSRGDQTVRAWKGNTGEERIFSEGGHPKYLSDIVEEDADPFLIEQSKAMRDHSEKDAISSKEDVYIAYSPNGTHLALGNHTIHCILQWEVETGKQFVAIDSVRIPHTLNKEEICSLSERLEALKGIPNEKVNESEVGYDPNDLQFFRLKEIRTEMDKFKRPSDLNHKIFGLTYSPNGKRLGASRDDKTVCQWEASTGKELTVSKQQTGDVLCVTYSSDSQRLASGSEDGIICQWEVETGELISVNEGHTAINSIAYNRDGNWLASGSNNGSIGIWEVSQDKTPIVIVYLNLIDFTAIQSIVFHSQNHIISGGNDGAIKYWRYDTSQEKPRWLLAWSTHGQSRALIAKRCDIDGAFGLSKDNQQLLVQLGAKESLDKFFKNPESLRLRSHQKFIGIRNPTELLEFGPISTIDRVPLNEQRVQILESPSSQFFKAVCPSSSQALKIPTNEIRKQALKKLFQQVDDILQTGVPNAKQKAIDLLTQAELQPMFCEHRNSSILRGGFGRTRFTGRNPSKVHALHF